VVETFYREHESASDQEPPFDDTADRLRSAARWGDSRV